MRRLLKNGNVINVFTGEITAEDVLIENEKIIGVGSYFDEDADEAEDVTGKYICPGFIDAHIHIESTMMTPAELARAALPHGTMTVVCDPHEIANVCGKKGIEYMLEASEGIPLAVYVMLPSCVPATNFDEAGAVLAASELEEFYSRKRVLGLGEMMNYPGVLFDDEKVLAKINSARKHGVVINGHAPLVRGRDLDKYISVGISDDHESSSEDEAKECIRKGQMIMIREGTAARNLNCLLGLFEMPWARRCMLVTDDKHPADILENGHIDEIIRRSVRAGKDPVIGIRMATLFTAEYYGLKWTGAVAPGYFADVLVLDDLEDVSVCDVYKRGECIVRNKELVIDIKAQVDEQLDAAVRSSFKMPELDESKFLMPYAEKKNCRVIKVLKGDLLTDEWIREIDFSENNGIDTQRDILKVAVVERHSNTGHIGLGFISGLCMKNGAIASSVSHDSHNLVIVGANEKDMAVAGNRVKTLGGGLVLVSGGEIIAELPLPVAGLMSELPAKEIAAMNENLRSKVHMLGVPDDIEPFLTTAFVSLPVIPHLKMTTHGLIDVDKQELVELFV